MKALMLILLPLSSLAATNLKNDAGTGKVEFLAVGRPSMLKIHGTADGPTANLADDGKQLKGSIDFDMSKLDTGIAMRTEHMKEKYLQVKEYPKATLTLTDAPVDAAFEKSLTSGEKSFKGKLSLHGKEHEVNGSYTAENGLVKAKFPLTLTDYAIDVPKYLGVTVANTVDVSVEIPLKAAH
jgi:polyisoprenoid-binding protein YceI